MLEFKDNPEELMQALDRFLSVYYGDRQVEYKPDLDEIATWNIPQPLKDLYSFVGKYPGKHGTFINTQDSLFLYPYIFNDKLCIISENQGVWSCGTEISGEDPPVYLVDWTTDKQNNSDWIYINDSLSQFLVTFCLREALFASSYTSAFKGKIEDTVSKMRELGYEVNLLWSGKYTEIESYIVPQLDSFYLLEDSILIWDMWDSSWCGTNYKNANRLITSLKAEFK